MQSSLHQINITYIPAEDRLLMRATTQGGDEYRIWMTRRFTKLLCDIVDQTMNKHGGAPVIGAEDKTRQMFKSEAFKKKFEEDKSTSYPLGENGFLAFAIKTGNNATGDLYLEIMPEKGQGVTFSLNKQLQYMLYTLLSQGIARADWSLTGSTGNPASNQPH